MSVQIAEMSTQVLTRVVLRVNFSTNIAKFRDLQAIGMIPRKMKQTVETTVEAILEALERIWMAILKRKLILMKNEMKRIESMLRIIDDEGETLWLQSSNRI